MLYTSHLAALTRCASFSLAASCRSYSFLFASNLSCTTSDIDEGIAHQASMLLAPRHATVVVHLLNLLFQPVQMLHSMHDTDGRMIDAAKDLPEALDRGRSPPML